jgi:predicted metal-dependent TIM-barrel fold hydrolase
MRQFRLLPESEQKCNETALLVIVHSPVRNLQIFVQYALHSFHTVNIFKTTQILENHFSAHVFNHVIK